MSDEQRSNWRDILGNRRGSAPLAPEGQSIDEILAEQDEKHAALDELMRPIRELADGYLLRKIELAQAYQLPDGMIDMEDLIGPPAERGMAHMSEWICALQELLHYRPQPIGYDAKLVMQDVEQRISALLLDLREGQELRQAATKAGYRHIDDMAV
jgi:hypothetical protein